MPPPKRLATHIKRGIVRMSWDSLSVYNLLQRTRMPEAQRSSTFEQTWLAKRETRGYHGEDISEDKFLRRHFDPLIKLPDMHSHPSTTASLPPIATLCFAELERRLDVAIFRCLFARSVGHARGMVVQGHVRVNGEQVVQPSYVLKDGDVFSVDPAVVVLLRSKEEVAAAKAAAAAAAAKGEKQSAVEEEDEGAKGAESDGKEQEQESDVAEPVEGEKTEADEAAATAPGAKQPSYTVPNVQLNRAALRRGELLEFSPPPYLAAFLFLPEYLEVDFTTCSAVFLRSPTVAAGKCELPSPLPAESHALAYEWYSRRYSRMSPRRTTQSVQVIRGQEVKLKKGVGIMWRKEEERREMERERMLRELAAEEKEKVRRGVAERGVKSKKTLLEAA
ncbi:alpha-L RNA-binding motif-containing protein [Gonapodya prolifera JEL478]|uniref:Alpha-L RNA-binding motif-containing protein n=1 Tax=Gonapodya prolifera (strain JEL478) TaxID=1344416 RepID=A0A139AMN2_GONPJ|nr:alpha-L RNA-binding motif-containing protein [Gonapodya prolifera JEL478]|eukprot:KXS17968.1 alpha-L RNA-binding motif-containing protein [Gonapodya prolifera JEL478]